MAEFLEVIHDWRRMCWTVQKNNAGKLGHRWCTDCPVKDECWSCTPFKNIEEIRARSVEEKVRKWAAENPEPIYPTWGEWLLEQGVVCAGTETRKGFTYQVVNEKFFTQIDSDTAQKLGIEPKEAE